MVPSPPAFSNSSRQPVESPPLAQRASPLAVRQPPVEEPSLDEALDKLLAMSFAQNHTAAHVEDPQLKVEAQCLGRGMQEVHEELILPLDRNSMQPDTYASATNTITDDSVDGGTDGNGDLDWADEELSMSFHDGLDGTMTPYTERPYTDGSMTPLTEASWMDESMTPSSCPGTPDVSLDLPLLQTPSIDRVSASGHVWPPVLLDELVLLSLLLSLMRLMLLHQLASASRVFLLCLFEKLKHDSKHSSTSLLTSCSVSSCTINTETVHQLIDQLIKLFQFLF